MGGGPSTEDVSPSTTSKQTSQKRNPSDGNERVPNARAQGGVEPAPVPIDVKRGRGIARLVERPYPGRLLDPQHQPHPYPGSDEWQYPANEMVAQCGFSDAVPSPSNRLDDWKTLKRVTIELKEIVEELEKPIKQMEKEGFWQMELFKNCKEPEQRIMNKLNEIHEAMFLGVSSNFLRNAHEFKSHFSEFLNALGEKNPTFSVKWYRAIQKVIGNLIDMTDDFPGQEPQPSISKHVSDEVPLKHKTTVAEAISKLKPLSVQLVKLMEESKNSSDLLNKNRKELKRKEIGEEIQKVKTIFQSAQDTLVTIDEIVVPLSESTLGSHQKSTVGAIYGRVLGATGSSKQILYVLNQRTLKNFEKYYEAMASDVEKLSELVNSFNEEEWKPLEKEPTGNNAIDLCAELKGDEEGQGAVVGTILEHSDVEEIVKVTRTLELGQPVEAETPHPLIKASTSTDSKDSSLSRQDPQDLLSFQNVLAEFCNKSIDVCKAHSKELKFVEQDGMKAAAIRHFIKIELDILNFQMRTALKTLGDDGETGLENPFFTTIPFGLSEKIIENHRENMRRMLSKIQNEMADVERCYKKKTTIKPTLDPRLHHLAFCVLSMYNSNRELMEAIGAEEVLIKSFAFGTLGWMFRLLLAMDTNEILPESSRIYFEECIKKTKKWFDSIVLAKNL